MSHESRDPGDTAVPRDDEPRATPEQQDLGDERSDATTPAPPSPGLARAAASGAAWLTAQKWVTRLSGLLTIAILTRAISPHEFGVVAAASVVLPFVYLLSDLGLSTYLVQTREAGRVTLSTGFWFSLAASLVLGLGLFAAVPLIVGALRVPEAAPVLRVLLASVPMVVGASVPTAILRRRLEFRRLAVQSAVAAAVAQVIAIVLALGGAGAWALVAQTLTANAITCAAAWWTAKWRPTWEFSRPEFRAMARFGYQVVAVELVAISRNWAETAIISIALGAEALGFLSIAQRLVQVVQELGGSAVAPVSVVVLSKVRDSAERLRDAYSRASIFTYAAVTPMLSYLAVAAPLLIPLVFGSQWGPSTPVARGLAVAGVLTVGAYLDHGLFYALGAPGRWLVYSTVTDAVTVGATALAVSHGLTAVAWAFVAVALLATVARWVLVSRRIGAKISQLALSFVRVMACTATASAIGLAVQEVTGGHLAVRAAVVGLAILGSYAIMLRLLLPAALADGVSVAPLPEGVRTRIRRIARLPR